MTTFPQYLTSLDYLDLENTFIPSEVPSKKLMIVLHGRGGKAEDFTWLAQSFAFEEMHYLFLNAPQVYEEGFSWYSDTPCHLESIKDASNLLVHAFDILFSKDFDASQSFLFGFSQGALLTFEVGAKYTKEFAGYIAISGSILNPELLLHDMNPELKNANWICTHGKHDDALSFQDTKAQVETLRQSGFNLTFKAYVKDHSIIEEELKMLESWIAEKSK